MFLLPVDTILWMVAGALSVAAFSEIALSCLACWQDDVCFLISLSLSLSLSGRSPWMNGILLNWTLSPNSIIDTYN